MMKPLGIKLTVDFAFKKTFGSSENTSALIGLLNAILELNHPIVTVEILNPFNYQEFADSKQIVLDVRCRDNIGRTINVEMQVAAQKGFTERLVYYACSMYVDQLSKGDSYKQIGRSISICLLRRALFADSPQAHHRFQMIDQKSGRLLNNAIEVHTVELTKYNLDRQAVARASPIEQWVFLLLYAQDYDAKSLKELLPGIEFGSAINALETISAKTEDKIMYDQREKALRDYEWMITSAREEGREEGEQLGVPKGKVLALQESLGDTFPTPEELSALTLEELNGLITTLQQRLRARLS